MSKKQQTEKGNTFRRDPPPGHAGESSELGWFDWFLHGWTGKGGSKDATGDGSGSASSIKNYPASTREE